MRITLLGVLVVVGSLVLLVVVLDQIGRNQNRNKGNGDEQPNNDAS